jgi:hypothetical protein
MKSNIDRRQERNQTETATAAQMAATTKNRRNIRSRSLERTVADVPSVCAFMTSGLDSLPA